MNYNAKAIIDAKYPVEEVGADLHQQMLYISVMVDTDTMAGSSTANRFRKYLELCRIEGTTPYFNNVTFSRFVTKTFGYEVKHERHGEKKYRVFRKTGEAHISR